MKQVYSNSEVPHIWASQRQQSARNSQGNIYFEGKEIFSYGRHFCLGRILDNNIVLLCDRSYSVTTSKQQREVSYAVNHMDKVFCPHPEAANGLEDNLGVWKNRIQTQLDIIGNPKKRATTKEAAKGELLSIVSNVDRYLTVTKQRIVKSSLWGKTFLMYYNAAKDEKASEQLAAKLEKQRLAKEKAVTKQRQERDKKEREYLNRWLGGEDIQIQWFSNIENVFLRVAIEVQNSKGFESKVQTSKGAAVSLNKAKRLFKLIQQGKDIKGIDIDGYTVIGINGVLTIGCHQITRTEINRFAALQGWGQIELH